MKTLRTIKGLESLARSVGATLERDPNGLDYQVWQVVAPGNMVWQVTGGPHLLVLVTPRIKGNVAEEVAGAAANIRAGLMEPVE